MQLMRDPGKSVLARRNWFGFYFWLNGNVTQFAKPVTFRHLNEPLDKNKKIKKT